MNLKDFLDSLILPVRKGAPRQYLIERKRLEWIFIAVRFLWVPVIFVLAQLHQPAQKETMMILGGVLGAVNLFVCFLNLKVGTPPGQKALGIAMLGFDTLIAWAIILLFVQDFYTAAYAGFVYIVIEAAIRFGMKGSLVMAAFFMLSLYVAYMYRSAVYDVRFSFSGYVFWVVLMSIIALMVGAIVREGQKQRALGEKRLQENTLLTERQRLARELHDTVLKTLQGLALEARALSGRTAETNPSVKETAQYIEEVCSRTGREIREVIFELRSGDVSAGIGQQITKLLDEWSGTSGISGRFSLTGKDIALPPETARQLKKIVTEALTNVQRHAAASDVEVNIKTSGPELILEIADNGRGIGRNTDELYAYVAEGRLGIAGMKERAELLGGRFTVTGGASGTRVTVNMPLPPVTGEI